MDFGLDKLIEMIEERFGRWASTCILLVVSLGVVALGLHLFFSDLVLPVTRTIFSAAPTIKGEAITHDELLTLVKRLIAGVLTVIVMSPMWFAITYFNRRWLTKMDRDVMRILKHEITIGLRVYREAINRAEAAGIDIKELEAEVERRAAADSILQADRKLTQEEEQILDRESFR